VIVFLVKKMRRIVIKVGTNILFKNNSISNEIIKSITDQINQLENFEIILVSSGAVAIGNSEMNIKFKHEDDIMRNVCASLGQYVLINEYSKYFKKKVGQILLSRNELSHRESFLKINELFENMLKLKILPIINENDVLRYESNKFRDNDHLAMKIASSIQADLLIILTNVHGVYTKDPREEGAELIAEADEEKLSNIQIGKRNGIQSLGGMHSKLDSAMLSSKLGIKTIIANGNEKGIITKIINGELAGTTFSAREKICAKKRWIMLSKEKGNIHLDEGAYNALKKRNSLLAIGIKNIDGEFIKDEVVNLVLNDVIIGKALIDHSSYLLKKIKGKSTKEIFNEIPNYKCIAKHENIILV
jgi:glutamate 5-kinase